MEANSYIASGDHWLAFLESYWIIFLVIAAVLAIRAALPSRGRPLILLAREICLAVSFYFVYYLVRGFVKDQVSAAYDRAHALVAFEQSIGLYHEVSVQRFAVRHDLLLSFVNWVYVWWYWPTLIFGLCWLFLRHNEHYLPYRNALLISGSIGLLIFALFPVAPPRFVNGLGITDTISRRTMTAHVILPTGLANEYAAMPSLHVGWTFLMGLAFVLYGRRLILRAVGVLVPLSMYLSVVATGNHYILDGFVGILVALTGLGLAYELEKRNAAGAATPEVVSAAPEHSHWPRLPAS